MTTQEDVPGASDPLPAVLPIPEQRHNNFDALRILAAVTVIYGHAHVLGGAPSVTLLDNAVESLAVKIFFVISGFLVAASWMSDPNPSRYLAKRSLRIFPGLLLVLLVTILVIGPIVTTLSTGEYFGSGALWPYLRDNMALYTVYSLPGVFAANSSPAVNGSLWSLPLEFLMYLSVPVIFWVSRISKSKLLLVASTLSLCVASLYLLRVSPLQKPYSLYEIPLSSALDFAPYFLLGSVYAATSLKRLLSPTVALFLIGMAALLQPTGALAMESALYLVLPYAILAFAAQSTPVISRAGRFGDPSYGIYLYGFVIQQAVYHFAGRHMSPLQNALVSVPIAIVLGYGSWHLVEKHALKIRPRAAAKREAIIPRRAASPPQRQPL